MMTDAEPLREEPAEPILLSLDLDRRVAGRRWFRDRVGETEAIVHRLHVPDAEDLYLKHGHGPTAEEVVDEFARLRWLRPRLSCPEPIGFGLEGETAWLLMTSVPGRTAFQELTSRPHDREATVAALAEHLRRIHGLPVSECPFNARHELRMAHARRRLDAGLIETDDFDEARAGWAAQDVWKELVRRSDFQPDLVVTHGDYSLDNILMEGGRVSGCIDVGRLGLADRHQDLAILCNCLNEFDESLRDLLLDGYGRRHVSPAKMEFHVLLDECF